MRACPSCGRENSDEARFCQFCATPLGEAEPAREARKIVTVLFADVTGSTHLGERLDPETLRRVMSRYFDAMRAVIERHGGTVEKFIGDAVMAVFGIPEMHEDDALRAVRAATEMRATLDDLNAELDRERGVTITTRTGLATGEVVATVDASSRERLATGDTVNVAARLEQSAEPGEILIAASTHALVRDAVEAETVPALELKGKTEPVPAYRLTAVRPGAAARERHLESPMVGREGQLRMLLDSFDASVRERACHLFTILGSPGVGKSRLVREFLVRVSDRAATHWGRCLSYGDGITFWPLDEIARSVTGVSEAAATDVLVKGLRDVLRDADESDAVVDRIAGLLGLSSEPVALADGFWAVRKLIEHVAAERPLVLVIDDIHWAEQTMFDLIEQIADWTRDAPIVLLCIARPELLDVRPNWGGGKLNATSILLEPLTSTECDVLIENLLGSAELPSEARERIASAAEGNPLFVEEMLAMLIDDGLLRRDDGRWVATADLSTISVPSSIQTLIAARLDRLMAEERTVIERGAVEGKLFHVGTVTALAPERLRETVRERLMSLVRKELIRPDRAEFAGDDAFRFRHILIRDAAYESMPKETRAELHERFAEWLGSRVTRTPGGLDAILAYHYEQAYRYRVELGGSGERERELAGVAADRYATAGEAALSRTDASTAIALLEHAASLAPDDLEVAVTLAGAHLFEGSMDRARELAEEVQLKAERRGDRRATLRAELLRTRIRTFTDPSWSLRAGEVVLRRIVEELDAENDHRGTAQALLELAFHSEVRADALAFARQAVDVARRGNDPRSLADAIGYEAVELFWGPTPAVEGITRCEEILAMQVPDRGTEARALSSLGGLRAMLGDFEAGRSLVARSRSILLELGTRNVAHPYFLGGYIGWLADDLDEAEASWREGFDLLGSIGETNRLSTLAALLALAFALRGRAGGALEYVRIGIEAGQPDDPDTQSLVRLAEAIVRSKEGEHEDAVRLANEAIAVFGSRESTWQLGDCYRLLGDVLAAAERRSEAADAYAKALEMYESKGVVPLVERTRAALAALDR